MPLSVWESISHHQEMLLPVVELSIKGFIALKTVTKMKKSGLKGLSLHCLEQDGALKGLSQRQWLRGIHEAWWLRHWPRMESKSISSLMHLAALGSSLSYSATGPGDGVATFLCLGKVWGLIYELSSPWPTPPSAPLECPQRWGEMGQLVYPAPLGSREKRQDNFIQMYVSGL